MKRAIGLIAHRRPYYLERTLASLAACDGIEDWVVHASLESGHAEVEQMARAFSACPIAVYINPYRYGPTLNFYNTFNRPFEAGFDYVALVEEDTPVARDFLRWHEFASVAFSSDPTIFTVAGGHYSDKGKVDPAFLPRYAYHSGFMNKGWATWRDRWFEPDGMYARWAIDDEFLPDGQLCHPTNGGYEGFIIRTHLKGRQQVYPVVTRVLDIGCEESVHCTPEVYERDIRISDWAGNYDLSNIVYRHEA